MTEGVRLRLPDGRDVEVRVRRSARARAIWLRVTARDGLVVTLPKGVGLAAALRLAESKADWVAHHLDALRSSAAAPGQEVPALPECLELRALGEVWTLDYQRSEAVQARVRVLGPGRLLVLGAADDLARHRAALLRWLMRHARTALAPWLDRLVQETGLSYSGLTIRNQRGRWGSCTHAGRISLNCKLLFLPPEQVRYVLVHELCHTREHNHSDRFWALLRRHEPGLDRLRVQMRQSRELVPDWVHLT